MFAQGDLLGCAPDSKLPRRACAMLAAFGGGYVFVYLIQYRRVFGSTQRNLFPQKKDANTLEVLRNS